MFLGENKSSFGNTNAPSKTDVRLRVILGRPCNVGDSGFYSLWKLPMHYRLDKWHFHCLQHQVLPFVTLTVCIPLT